MSDKELTELIEKVHEKEKKKFWQKILVALIPMLITAFIGSYLGIRTTVKVDSERIKHNSKTINQHESQLQSLQKSDTEQWFEIGKLQSHKTRGMKIDNENVTN
jgi:uncharacterized membrane protein (DUF106 family)